MLFRGKIYNLNSGKQRAVHSNRRDNHIKENVAHAISTGQFKDGILINIMQRAAIVREGDKLVKCRYDLGDMLEAFHVAMQAELKESASIFAIPFVLEDAQRNPTVED